MTEMFGIKLRKKLLTARWFDADELAGCTLEELEQLRIGQGVESLPGIYIDYMLVMGKRLGHLEIENSVFPNVAKLKNIVTASLKEQSHSFRLSDDTFVCALFEDFRVMYFHTKDVSDDPPVYGFEIGQDSRGEDDAREIELRLSRWLTWVISYCASTYSTSTFSRKTIHEAREEQEMFLTELGLA